MLNSVGQHTCRNNDVNHKISSDRSYPTPAGYNRPEARKHSHENLTASDLEVHFSALYICVSWELLHETPELVKCT